MNCQTGIYSLRPIIVPLEIVIGDTFPFRARLPNKANQPSEDYDLTTSTAIFEIYNPDKSVFYSAPVVSMDEHAYISFDIPDTVTEDWLEWNKTWKLKIIFPGPVKRTVFAGGVKSILIV